MSVPLASRLVSPHTHVEQQDLEPLYLSIKTLSVIQGSWSWLYRVLNPLSNGVFGSEIGILEPVPYNNGVFQV